MRKVLMLFWALTLLLMIGANATTASNPQIAVAIMTFVEGQIDGSWSGWALPEGITNLVTDELVNRNKVIVVERTRIEQLLSEQNLGAEDIVEAQTASQIGKMLGARLMVMGTITEFDMKQTAGVGISFLRVRGSQATVSLTGRIVDTETGQILGSLKGSGSKTGASFAVDDFKGISLDAEQFQSSTLGVATTNAVKEFVDELVKAVDKAELKVVQAEAATSKQGTVAAVLPGDQIVTSLGSKHGVRQGAKLKIENLMSIPGIKDPVRIPVGTATVISVMDEASVAKVDSKTQDIQQGDVVSIQ